MSISGTVTSKSAFLNSIGLPFDLVTASNVTREFKATFTTSDITKLYAKELVVLAGYGTTLDLTDLLDVWGAEISFTTVKHLQVVNETSTSVAIGGGSTPLFDECPEINEGCLNLTSEFPVTAYTNNLFFQSAAGTVTVDVVIAGT